MISGYWTSQAIYVAAKLQIADHLADGPQTVARLAEASNAHPQNLLRVLRALASMGIFEEQSEGSFGLSRWRSACDETWRVLNGQRP